MLAMSATQESSQLPGALPTAPFTSLPPTAPLTERVTRTGHGSQRASTQPNAGLLSINTHPWSTVYLGSRLLGSTPLANIQVPRGTLMLRMVDRDGRVHLRRIAAAKQQQRTAFFQF